MTHVPHMDNENQRATLILVRAQIKENDRDAIRARRRRHPHLSPAANHMNASSLLASALSREHATTTSRQLHDNNFMLTQALLGNLP